MPRYLSRYLKFLSISVLTLSCNSYLNLQKNQSGENCILKFKPDFNKVIYSTSADANEMHVSGLTLIKYMPDSSTRIVFTSEMGFPYFDFGFLTGNRFVIYQITPKMNKKYLIRTLRKDFELILFRNLDSNTSYIQSDSFLTFHAYPQADGINYYITDSRCLHLLKMERASKKKPVMEARFSENIYGITPDSIIIRHLNYNFTISLKKISSLAPQ